MGISSTLAQSLAVFSQLREHHLKPCWWICENTSVHTQTTLWRIKTSVRRISDQLCRNCAPVRHQEPQRQHDKEIRRKRRRRQRRRRQRRRRRPLWARQTAQSVSAAASDPLSNTLGPNWVLTLVRDIRQVAVKWTRRENQDAHPSVPSHNRPPELFNR